MHRDHSPEGERRRFPLPGVLLLAGGGVAFGILAAIPRPQAVFLIERGPVAFLTAGFYLAASLLALRAQAPGFPHRPVAGALLALSILELGIGDRLASLGIAGVRHHDPLITGGLLAVLGASVAFALRGPGRRLPAPASAPGIAALAGSALLLLTLGVDRVQKAMQDRGPTGDRYLLGMAEEVLEVVVPCFFILALLELRRRRRNRESRES